MPWPGGLLIYAANAAKVLHAQCVHGTHAQPGGSTWSRLCGQLRICGQTRPASKRARLSRSLAHRLAGDGGACAGKGGDRLRTRGGAGGVQYEVTAGLLGRLQAAHAVAVHIR